MTMGAPPLCGHCGRPIASLNDEDRLVYVGQTPYHYACTQPPKQYTLPAPMPAKSPRFWRDNIFMD